MKTRKKPVLALTTAPDLKTARKLARAALKDRLIACANLIPDLESHYWWKGKIETSPEVLLLLKTTTDRIPALEKLILALHPYQTAEFVVLDVTKATPRYLKWWTEAVK
jgi:periplasmic divalent cation tolerance protein